MFILTKIIIIIKTFELSTYLKLPTAVIKKISVALIHIGPHKSGFPFVIFKKSGLNGKKVALILYNTSVSVTLK